jgi:hypothetical protein
MRQVVELEPHLVLEVLLEPHAANPLHVRLLRILSGVAAVVPNDGTSCIT